jgi:aldose 1-epimerase
MSVKVVDFGQTSNGETVKQVVIENANGHQLGLISYGASWQFFKVKEGTQYRDVVAGFSNVADYESHPFYLGNAIGRVAGRIGGASFELNGQTYQLDKNEGENTLHGGSRGFSDRNWDTEIDQAHNAAIFTAVLAEDEDGFPGIMTATVTYTLTDDDEVRIEFKGSADADTLFNPTSHAYLNPAGLGTDARDLILYLAAPRRLEMAADLIPTGKKLDTAGTAYDFTTPARIGDKIAELPGDAYNKSFDEPFEVAPEAGKPAAVLTDPKSTRAIELYSDRNAMITFVTNPGLADHEGDVDWFNKHPFNMVALEAQTLSDAIHFPEFGDIVLPAETEKVYTTVYAFKNI